MKQVLLLLSMFAFLGFGCVSTNQISFLSKDSSPSISELSAEDAALALNLTTGSSIELEQTVFGFGQEVTNIFSDTSPTWSILIQTFTSAYSVELSWSKEAKEETAASKEAWQAYESLKHSTPIGEPLAQAPERIYETVTTTGFLASEALEKGNQILLPSSWESNSEKQTDKTLIWLSRTQYQELINTRTTTLSLGLFDEKLSSIKSVTNFLDRLKSFIQQKDLSQEIKEKEEKLYQVEADGNWREYELKVDGETRKVRTVHASNWFGSYEILANPDNPLILKVDLNPLSFGSLEDLQNTFIGYVVKEITLKPLR